MAAVFSNSRSWLLRQCAVLTAATAGLCACSSPATDGVVGGASPGDTGAGDLGAGDLALADVDGTVADLANSDTSPDAYAQDTPATDTLATDTLATDTLATDATAVPVGNWIRQLGGAGYEQADVTAFDAAGWLYVAGLAGGGAEFGGSVIAGDSSSSHLFIAAYGVSGKLQWLAQAPLVDAVKVTGIAVNASRVAITGSYQGTGFAVGTAALPNTTSASIYYLALASATGSAVASGRIDIKAGFVLGGPVALDGGNNVYVAGNLDNTFMHQWHADGSAGYHLPIGTVQPLALAVDEGRLFLGGQMSSGQNIGGDQMLTPLAATAFVAQLQASTGVYVWGHRVGGGGAIQNSGSPDTVRSLTVSGNSVYVGGQFNGALHYGKQVVPNATGGAFVVRANAVTGDFGAAAVVPTTKDSVAAVLALHVVGSKLRAVARGEQAVLPGSPAPVLGTLLLEFDATDLQLKSYSVATEFGKALVRAAAVGNQGQFALVYDLYDTLSGSAGTFKSAGGADVVVVQKAGL